MGSGDKAKQVKSYGRNLRCRLGGGIPGCCKRKCTPRLPRPTNFLLGDSIGTTMKLLAKHLVGQSCSAVNMCPCSGDSDRACGDSTLFLFGSSPLRQRRKTARSRRALRLEPL